jgi:hypothetical protein
MINLDYDENCEIVDNYVVELTTIFTMNWINI